VIDIFINSFGITFKAMLQIFLIAAAAGVLMRKKVITQEHLKVLSSITVQVLLPCLTFSNIIRNFQPGQLKSWPLF
jgi:predicted permease